MYLYLLSVFLFFTNIIMAFYKFPDFIVIIGFMIQLYVIILAVKNDPG